MDEDLLEGHTAVPNVLEALVVGDGKEEERELLCSRLAVPDIPEVPAAEASGGDKEMEDLPGRGPVLLDVSEAPAAGDSSDFFLIYIYVCGGSINDLSTLRVGYMCVFLAQHDEHLGL